MHSNSGVNGYSGYVQICTIQRVACAQYDLEQTTFAQIERALGVQRGPLCVCCICERDVKQYEMCQLRTTYYLYIVFY